MLGTVCRQAMRVSRRRFAGEQVRSFRWTAAKASEAEAARPDYPPIIKSTGKPASPKVLELVDQIADLNLLEMSALIDTLQAKLGLPAMPFGGGMPMGFGAPMGMPAGGAPGAPGGAAAAPAAEEPKAEKKEFDVKLKAFDAKNKIKVIKEVRAITGLGLKEAKDLVEGVPAVLKKAIKKEEADEIAAKLKEVGAELEIE